MIPLILSLILAVGPALAADPAPPAAPADAAVATEATAPGVEGAGADGEAVEGEGAVDASEEAAGPDRSGPPPVQRSPRLNLPEPEVHPLGAGAEAWYVPVDGVRRVEVYVVLHRGHHELAGGPTEAGMAVGDLMDVATSSYAADALSELQDLHEIELSSWISHHNGGVRLSVPGESLEVGLDLLAEVLRAPAYPRKDIVRHLRDRRLFYEVSGPSSPRQVAASALSYAWFPGDHPYGARPDLAAMRKIAPSQLHELHGRWLSESPITVLVTGDLPWSELEPRLQAVVGDLGASGDRAPRLEVAPPAATRVVAVDMPGQAQTTLALRLAAPLRDDADRVPFEVLNHALGGHFLSRLNANLREDKGFTYGTRSSYVAQPTSGHLTISVDVAAENAAPAIGEIEHELARIVESGVTAEEIEWAARSALFDWNETRATAGSTRGFYAQRLFDEETVAEVAARQEAAARATPEAVTEVAERWLAADRPRVWVVVGDRKLLADQLAELGFEAEWITPEAALLGSL